MIKVFYKEIENAKLYSQKFLREIFEAQFGLPYLDSTISFNKFGKPYLTKNSNLHFNLSHSAGAIICAFSIMPVGIDIELVKSYNNKIVKRYFTEDEQDYIFCNEDNINSRFTEIWTKKEAYVKWLGLGISMPFDSFSVIGRCNLISFYINKYCISLYNEEIEKIYPNIEIVFL